MTANQHRNTEALFLGVCVLGLVLAVLVILRTNGFFAPSRWHAPGDQTKTHEISLNPSHLSVRTLRETDEDEA